MNIENYRPISIKCAPAKPFELISYCKLYTHVENYIVPQQHGFVSKKSSNTNLFLFSNHAFESMKCESQLDVIYTDFSNAFNKVDPDILLEKLGSFGLSHNLLRLFKSYLENRYIMTK